MMQFLQLHQGLPLRQAGILLSFITHFLTKGQHPIGAALSAHQAALIHRSTCLSGWVIRTQPIWSGRRFPKLPLPLALCVEKPSIPMDDKPVLRLDKDNSTVEINHGDRIRQTELRSACMSLLT